jgi:hypothetical protein
MQEQGSPKIATVDEAVEALFAWQEREGGVRTIPASADTIESEAGWAFFNVNSYLGTVTPDGEVVFEDQFAEDES